MPTYLRSDGFVVRIHGPPREHGPPHVHVHVHRGREGFVVVGLRLGAQRGRVWLREDFGLSRRDILAAVRLVEQHAEQLLSHWERMHGSSSNE